MSRSARAGLFIYAMEPGRVAEFYETVAGMSRLHETDEIIVMESEDIQLLVHKIPSDIAQHIEITEPPIRRSETALKFFFTVPSLVAAKSLAAKHGGQIFAEQWQSADFAVCNGMDPEGNVFQIRESNA